MKLKIFEVASNAPNLIEDTINSWLDNKEFNTISVQNITEYSGTKIGVRVYLLYEEVAESLEV